MDEMDEIVNTVQFRFPPASPRPSWSEIANFVKQLEEDLLLIETAYRTAHDRSLFVKFVSREAMIGSLKKNAEPRRFLYTNGTAVEVRMSIAGSTLRYVRVFDLPPEVSDEKLSLAMSEYGKVERLVREKFPADLGLGHMYTGVRGVYIELNKEIPPAIEVGKRRGYVFYDGLKDTCFLCHAVGHRKNSCPQRQPRKQQQPGSYAAVLSGEEIVTAEQKSVDISEVIELTEDEIIEEMTESTDAEEQQTEESRNQLELEKEKRRKKGIETLKEVAHAITEAMVKQQASQRRAQFASTGSKEHSRPKKLCARKSLY